MQPAKNAWSARAVVSAAAGALILSGALASGASAEPAASAATAPAVVAAPATVTSPEGYLTPDVPDATAGSAEPTEVIEVALETADVLVAEAPGAQLPQGGAPADVDLDLAPALEAVPARGIDLDDAKMLGVTWQGAGPDRLEMRSQGSDGVWTEWSSLDLDQDPDGEGGGTELWWTGGSVRAEVRSLRDGAPVDDELTLVVVNPEITAVDTQLAASAGLDQAATAPSGPDQSGSDAPMTVEQSSAVDLLGGAGVRGRLSTSTLSSRPTTDSVGGPTSAASAVAVSSTLPGATPLATGVAPVAPVVITRGQWAAGEVLAPTPANPSLGETTLATVLHHTAGTNTYTAAQSPGIVRGIYRYHAVTRGWGDIGYNVLVDQYGQIFEGRGGGLTIPRTGAHAGGFNTNTFGVSMMGDYSNVAPSAAMRESVARIIAWKMGGVYRFDSLGTETIVAGTGSNKFPPGTPVQVYHILAHRDVGLTACPGAAGYAALPGIRARVNELSGASRTQIWSAWESLGGFRGLFGNVYQVETDYAGGGSAVYFNNGYTVAYHPSIGTASIAPLMRPVWLASGAFTGVGYPTTNTFAVGDARGSAQEFSNGYSTLYTPTTGGRYIGGPVRALWWQSGGASGWMGYPSLSQSVVGDGRGTFAEFENSVSILSTPTTGTAAISGALRTEWWRTGGTLGSLGYPNLTQSSVGDGRGLFVQFERDASILWTPTTGARTLSGPLRAAWWGTGGATGALGYPTLSASAVGDGRGTFAEFEKDASIISSPTTGAHAISGELRLRWWREGGTAGAFGYPTTGVTSVAGTQGSYVSFESNRSIVWSRATGAHPLYGPLRDKWMSVASSGVGLPSAEPVNFTGVAGGYSALSSGAWIVWGPSTGAYVVPSAMRQRWIADGGASGSWGLPVADATTTGGKTTQRFERGTMTL